jgi:glycosyltransferase involved in cell wall biosynthesis
VENIIFSNSVLVDVTNFLNNPTRTGIQRYIDKILSHWPQELELVLVVINDEDTIHILNPGFVDLIKEYFCADDPRHLLKTEMAIKNFESYYVYTSNSEILSAAKALLLPELTWDIHQLKFLTLASTRFPNKIFILTFDFIPFLHPEYYPNFNWALNFSFYIDLLRNCKNIAFISSYSKKQLEDQILHKNVANSCVIGGGADTFENFNTFNHHPPHFLYVSTIKPRKNQMLVLDVFERLWSQGYSIKLTFVGTHSELAPYEIDRITTLSRHQPYFNWFDNASDRELNEIYLNASATLYISSEEGLGLPVLESLYLGIPCIVNHSIPALEFVKCGGVIQIQPSFQELYDSIISLTDHHVLQSAKDAIDIKTLPTWHSVISILHNWISQSLNSTSHSPHFPELPTVYFSEIFAQSKFLLISLSDPDIHNLQILQKSITNKPIIGLEIMDFMYLQNFKNNPPIFLQLYLLHLLSKRYITIQDFQKLIISAYFLNKLQSFNNEQQLLEIPRAFAEDAVDDFRNTILFALEVESTHFVEFCYSSFLRRPLDYPGSLGYQNNIKIEEGSLMRLNIIYDIVTSHEFKSISDPILTKTAHELFRFDFTSHEYYTIYRRLLTGERSRDLYTKILNADTISFCYFANIYAGLQGESIEYPCAGFNLSYQDKIKYLDHIVQSPCCENFKS